jgi:5'-3' exonuclease
LEVIVQVAEYEGEALTAHLVRQGLCDIGLSDDSDSLAFLSPRTAIGFGIGKPSFEVIHLDTILEDLHMSPKEFQEFCILLGLDFIQRLPKVGPQTLLTLFKSEDRQSKNLSLREAAYLKCQDKDFVREHEDL